MRFLLLISLIVGVNLSLTAQDKYVFKADLSECPEVKEVDCQMIPYLSKDVSIKMAQFCEVYTKKVEFGSHEQYSSLEIDKPDLYYSIQKLSKYYCKGLKKGILNKEEAESELNEILEKCLAIHSQETQPLEEELKAAGKPVEIVQVFHKVILE